MSKNLWDEAAELEPEDGAYVDSDEEEGDDKKATGLAIEKSPR